MSLITKYRPSSLKDFYGDTGTLEVLFDRKDEDIPNAFLFTGDSGTGKTTLGRIVLNKMCDCSDIEELNSANFRGIDTIRNIEIKSRLFPFGNGRRGFLLDEAHQLTSQAQEMLLKMMEEPPADIVFVFCTTEPGKLKSTFKNRCFHFQTKPLNKARMKRLLKQIAKEEEASIEDDVIGLIYETTDGSPRKAISALDSVIDLAPDEQYDAVYTSMEDDVDVKQLLDLLFKCQNWKEVGGALRRVKKEPETLRIGLVNVSGAMLINGKKEAFLVMDVLRDPFHYQATARSDLQRSCYEIWNELHA